MSKKEGITSAANIAQPRLPMSLPFGKHHRLRVRYRVPMQQASETDVSATVAF